MPDVRQNIGRYEVTAEVGRGSMGIVHLARDPVMDRDVAIKTILLPRGLEGDMRVEFQERFQREAQAAGRLSHPGIVTVYEFNQSPDDQLPFIAMEYVEGPTLHELIVKEGALRPEWALSIAETLISALGLAHDAGVIHRDLKPANILVREADGVAKIADFGVARVNQCNAGKMYGSPAYVAPECIRGHSADTRSDLFSLAVIMYETLTGKRPFGGKDFDTICHAITHDAPEPIRRYSADLTPAFDRFFARALAKDPADRFPDAYDFREAIRALYEEQIKFQSGASTCILPAPGLQDVTEDQTAVPGPSPMSKRWRILGPAALVLVLLVFGAGWGLLGSRSTDARLPAQRTPIRLAVAPPPVQTLAESYEMLEPTVVPQPTPAEAEVEQAGATEPADASDSSGSTATAPEPAEVKKASRAVTPPAKAKAKPAPVPVPKAVPVAKPIEQAEPEPTQPPLGKPATAVALQQAYVELQVKNSIKSGKLTVLVDGTEVYSNALAVEAEGISRAFKKTVGKADQQFDKRLEIPAGLHTIVVRAYSEPKDKQYEDSIELDLEPGQSRTLTVTAGRTFGRRLTIKTDSP